jgi:amiloride-sensitive sodium channel subunit alpha
LFEDTYTGISVVIADVNQFPIRSEGVVIKAGSYAKINLKKTESTNLPSPYSSCQEIGTFNTTLSNEMNRIGIKYSHRNCVLLCQQKIIIDRLGCYRLDLPRIFDAPPCLNQSIYNQLLVDYIDFSTSDCNDLCPFECYSVTYELSVSYTDFPSYKYYNRYMRLDKPFFANVFKTENVTYEMFKNSMASLFIYIDDNKSTQITESIATPVVQFIANLGGTLGLFVGTSVLSLMEIVELLIDLIFILFQSYNFCGSRLVNAFNRKGKSNDLKLNNI